MFGFTGLIISHRFEPYELIEEVSMQLKNSESPSFEYLTSPLMGDTDSPSRIDASRRLNALRVITVRPLSQILVSSKPQEASLEYLMQTIAQILT